MSKLRDWARMGKKFGSLNDLGFEKTPVGRFAANLDKRWDLRRTSYLMLYCVVLASLIFSDIDFTYSVRAGEVASMDIKSPVNLELVDEAATEDKRRTAEEGVAPVFDYDPNAYEQTFTNVYRSFLTMRRLARTTVWPTSPAKLEEAVKDFMVNQTTFETEIGRSIPLQLFEWLSENRFSARIENVLIRALAKWSNGRLVDGGLKHLRDTNEEVIVRVLRPSTTGEEYAVNREDLQDIGKLGDFNLDDVRGAATLDARELRQVMSLAHILLTPNLTINLKETEDRRRKARETVPPENRRITKNQVIVSEGAVIQPIHMAIIREIEDLNSARNSKLISLVAALLFVTLILVCLSYMRRFTANKVNVTNKELAAMGTVAIIVVLITKMFLVLTDHVVMAKLGGGVVPPSALLYLAPVATGSMLVGLLVTSGEIVWLFTMFLGTVLSFLVDMNFGFLLVSIIGGIAGGRGVFGCKQRTDIYRAGLRVGLIAAVTIFLVTLLQQLGDSKLLTSLLWNVPAGFVSGIIASVLTMGIVPILESAFNFTTDIKLLELASLNHPVMKEMIVKAPGTYHHSLVVGSMCEAAAEEIGANPLLAKVMAYYHDIGKTEHAQYFIENQRPGQNPHDHISPNMSKTVLIAHVKDGAEMGFKHRLGKPIIDGILQHHGTTLISFFYNKAMEEGDPDTSRVNEEDFRYPGPKPQFREAALVMLADSIEAAARSLDEPTTGRLQNIVKNVIQNKFLDGQLEECNLTLKDLTVIEAAFKRILLSIYHHRIEYPMKYSAASPRAKDRKGHTAG